MKTTQEIHNLIQTGYNLPYDVAINRLLDICTSLNDRLDVLELERRLSNTSPTTTSANVEDRTETNGPHWSDHPPTEPGHYWVRLGSERRGVVEVVDWNGSLQAFWYGRWERVDNPAFWKDLKWWTEKLTPTEPQP